MLVVTIICCLISCIAAFKRSHSLDSSEEANKLVKIEEEPKALFQPPWLFFKFMDAIEKDDEKDLIELVHGGDFLVNGYMLCVRANEQITPLMMAAQKGNLMACLILMKADAKLNLLSLETKRGVMDFAGLSGDSDLVETLKTYFEPPKPMDMDELVDDFGKMANLSVHEPKILRLSGQTRYEFLAALGRDDDSYLLSLINSGDFPIDGYMHSWNANDDITPLMTAALEGKLSACLILIEAGANMDLLSLKTKHNFIDYAWKFGGSEFFDALNSFYKSFKLTGASSCKSMEPSMPSVGLDVSSLSPVLELFDLIKSESGQDLGDKAAINKVDIVRLIENISPLESADHWSYLVSQSLEFDFSERVFHAIFSAEFHDIDYKKFGNENVVSAFIKRMASPTEFVKRGVEGQNKYEILQELICRRPVNLNVLDIEGRNPLMLALENEQQSIAYLLATFGATGLPLDSTGESPYEMIARLSCDEGSDQCIPVWNPRHTSRLPSYENPGFPNMRCPFSYVLEQLGKNEILLSYLAVASGFFHGNSDLSIFPRDILKYKIGPAMALMYRYHFKD